MVWDLLTDADLLSAHPWFKSRRPRRLVSSFQAHVGGAVVGWTSVGQVQSTCLERRTSQVDFLPVLQVRNSYKERKMMWMSEVLVPFWLDAYCPRWIEDIMQLCRFIWGAQPSWSLRSQSQGRGWRDRGCDEIHLPSPSDDSEVPAVDTLVHWGKHPW